MDNRVDELIHEVEEQLKWERFEKILKDYGIYIAAVILSVILGVAGYVYWNHHQQQKQEELSEKYTKAITLLGKGQTQEALEQLKAIPENEGSYGMLSRFVSASALVDDPKTRPQAIAIYREMITNRTIDRRYRNLAIIFTGLAEMDSTDPKELIKLIEEARVGTNMWPDTTAELTALAAIKEGNIEQAKTILTELKNGKQTPRGIQIRADALLQHLQQTK